MTAPVILPDHWKILRTPPADGPTNMAIDLALMESAKIDGAGILRVYGWSRPTISFGRNERVAGLYDPAEMEALGLGYVRRPTGGRALLHAREITYSVAIPLDDQSRWPVAYAAVNQRLLAAMLDLGVPARISAATSSGAPTDAEDGTAPHDQSVVCFSGIAAGEIAVGERKLVASSVWRDRAAYLQHGSILIHDDQALLERLMGTRVARPEPGAALSEYFANGTPDHDIIDQTEIALTRAFAHCGNTVKWSIPIEVRKQVDVTRLALASADWLWRR